MARIVGFLQYYLSYFGDHGHRFVDLLPQFDRDSRPHLALDAKFSQPIAPDKSPAEVMDNYTHPCWCNPELIYADDLKGNEVWLHKPVQ